MILVFGAGLLGSVFKSINYHREIVVIPKAICDVTDIVAIDNVVREHRPSHIINCAGIVPKNTTTNSYMYMVNAAAPKLIAKVADTYGAKVIHISTNCVFPSDNGPYYPYDPAGGLLVDDYGHSKLLGELGSPHVTLRTSFVGLPDPKGRGLLHWASKQDQIMGYDRVMWNGVTTQQLVDTVLNTVMENDITGVHHIYSPETISKYELLTLASGIFKWNIPIQRESIDSTELHIGNNTLIGCDQLNLGIPSIVTQLLDMKEYMRHV